jgi:hypothetical protein
MKIIDIASIALSCIAGTSGREKAEPQRTGMCHSKCARATLNTLAMVARTRRV